jgi:hypothetical protein
VGFFIHIPHGDGDKVFQSSVVQQLAVADDFSSAFLIKMVVDVCYDVSQGWCWARDLAAFSIFDGSCEGWRWTWWFSSEFRWIREGSGVWGCVL